MAVHRGRIHSAPAARSIPILHYRSYNDPVGDIHDRVRDFCRA